MPAYNYTNQGEMASRIFGTGLGSIASISQGLSAFDYYELSLTCAVKSNTLYFGTETYLSTSEEFKSDISLKIYPQPNSGLFYIRYEGGAELEIKVLNLCGQLVYSGTQYPTDAGYPVNISDVSSGIYFAEVYSNGKLIGREKIIKSE